MYKHLKALDNQSSTQLDLIYEKKFNRKKFKIFKEKSGAKLIWHGSNSHYVEILVKKLENDPPDDLTQEFKPLTGMTFLATITTRFSKINPIEVDYIQKKTNKKSLAEEEILNKPQEVTIEESDDNSEIGNGLDDSLDDEDGNEYYVAHYTDKNKIEGVFKKLSSAIKKYNDIIKEETKSVALDYFLLLDDSNLGYLSPVQMKTVVSRLKVHENITFEKFHDILVRYKINIQQKRDEKYALIHRRLYKWLPGSLFEVCSMYRAYKIQSMSEDKKNKEDFAKNYIKASMNIFEQASEISDIVSDLIVAITIYRAGVLAVNSTPYLVLTAVYMFSTAAPYILSYSSGIQLMIKKGILNDEAYKELPKIKKIVIFGMLTVFGPFFFVFLHIFDIIVGCIDGFGTFFLPQVQYEAMMIKVLKMKFSLGLNEMEYEGFLLQRKIAQIMFESLISFVINIIMLSSNFFQLDSNLSNSQATIIFSLCTTVFNLIVQIFVLKLQSNYFEESFLNYCLICMKARFGWIPFRDSIEKCQLKKNIDYANLKFYIPLASRLLGIYLKISCEFSDNDIRTLKNAFEAFKSNHHTITISDQNYEVKIGKALKNVSIDSIAHLLVSMPNDHIIRLNLDGISWKTCIENKLINMRLEKDAWHWEPTLPTGEHLLKACIDSEKDGKIKFFDMFQAILESHAETDGFNSFGESLLFYTVKTNKIESLKLLLKYKASPSIQNKFTKETPLSEAISRTNFEMIKLLLQAKSSPHLQFRYKNSEDMTCLILPIKKLEAQQGNQDIEKICELLIEHRVIAETPEEKDTILVFLQASNNPKHIKLALNLIGKEKIATIRDSKGSNILHYFFRSPTSSFYQAFEALTEEERQSLLYEKNENKCTPVTEALYHQSNLERLQRAISVTKLDFTDEVLQQYLYNRMNVEMEKNNEDVLNYLLDITVSDEKLLNSIINTARAFRNRKLLRHFKSSKFEKFSYIKKNFISDDEFGDAEEIEAPKDIALTDTGIVALEAPNQDFIKEVFAPMLRFLLSNRIISKRTDLFERSILFVLEIIALFDFAGDMIVLIGLAGTNNIGWTSLTILSMLCPYLVSYAPLITFFIERKHFRANSNCWTTTTKALMMTPICILYILLLDLLYIFCTILIEPIDIIFSILTCQKYNSIIDVDKILDKILSKSFGLKIMDAKGFKRLRSMSQFIFESVPQILLQVRILTYGSQNFGINVEGIIFSLVSAIVHATIEFILLAMESKACKSSFLYYSVVSLNGRFNWVPFSEKFSTSGVNSNTELDYGKMGYRFLCSHFEMSYEFSNETLEIFTASVRYLPEVEEKSSRVKIKLGSTCNEDVTLANINLAILAADNRVDLDVEDIDFESLFAKEIKYQFEPLAPNGDYLIIFYAERDCVRAVKALIKLGVNIDVTSKKNGMNFLSLKIKDELRIKLLDEIIKSKSSDLISKFFRAEPNLVSKETRLSILKIAQEHLDKGRERNALKMLGFVGGFHSNSKYGDYSIFNLLQELSNHQKLFNFAKRIKEELLTSITLIVNKQKYEIKCEDAEVIRGFRAMANGMPIGFLSGDEERLGSPECPFDTSKFAFSPEEISEFLATLNLTRREKNNCGRCGKGVAFRSYVYQGSFICNRCSNSFNGESYHCPDCQFDLCPNCHEICLTQKGPTCILCSDALVMVELGFDQSLTCKISCWANRLCKRYYKCLNHNNITMCEHCFKNMYES